MLLWPVMTNSTRTNRRPKYIKVRQEAFTPKEAAIIIGVHHITIRRWIRQSKIRAYRVGGYLVRIPRSEIARMRTLRITYLDNCQRPSYPIV